MIMKFSTQHPVTAQSNTNKGQEEGGDDEINFRIWMDITKKVEYFAMAALLVE